MVKGKRMDLREVVKKYKQFKIPSLSIVCEKASQYSKTCLLAIIILFTVFVYLVQQIPHWQVAQFGIINPKDIADAENSYRATLAQIFGGIAIAIGLYYTWRRITIAEEDLKATKEGQITERFTRAVEQLGAIDQQGNPAIEIRLGGIYALERIANESEKDYWPIMEILTAYVRKNSPAERIEIEIDYDLMACRNYEIKKEKSEVYKLPLDIQAILTVIGRRKYSPYSGETEPLNLEKTNLSRFNLVGANLEGANLEEADLESAKLQYSNLHGANLHGANLHGANLIGTFLHDAIFKKAKLQHATLANAVLTNANLQEANFKHAFLGMANFESADFGHDDDISLRFLRDWYAGANLENAYLKGANLKNANLKRVNLKEANLEGAILEGAKNLTVDQLSKVKTLYQAKLDPQLEEELRSKGYSHLLDNKP